MTEKYYLLANEALKKIKQLMKREECFKAHFLDYAPQPAYEIEVMKNKSKHTHNQVSEDYA